MIRGNVGPLKKPVFLSLYNILRARRSQHQNRRDNQNPHKLESMSIINNQGWFDTIQTYNKPSLELATDHQATLLGPLPYKETRSFHKNEKQRNFGWHINTNK